RGRCPAWYPGTAAELPPPSRERRCDASYRGRCASVRPLPGSFQTTKKPPVLGREVTRGSTQVLRPMPEHLACADNRGGGILLLASWRWQVSSEVVFSGPWLAALTAGGAASLEARDA